MQCLPQGFFKVWKLFRSDRKHFPTFKRLNLETLVQCSFPIRNSNHSCLPFPMTTTSCHLVDVSTGPFCLFTKKILPTPRVNKKIPFIVSFHNGQNGPCTPKYTKLIFRVTWHAARGVGSIPWWQDNGHPNGVSHNGVHIHPYRWVLSTPMSL